MKNHFILNNLEDRNRKVKCLSQLISQKMNQIARLPKQIVIRRRNQLQIRKLVMELFWIKVAQRNRIGGKDRLMQLLDQLK